MKGTGLIWTNLLDGACFPHRLIRWLVIWFRVKRMRSDLVGKKLRLMRGKLWQLAQLCQLIHFPGYHDISKYKKEKIETKIR